MSVGIVEDAIKLDFLITNSSQGTLKLIEIDKY